MGSKRLAQDTGYFATYNRENVTLVDVRADPIVETPDLTPAATKTAMKNWHSQCGITGGWVWIFDQIAGSNLVRKYAQAITKGVGGAAR